MTLGNGTGSNASTPSQRWRATQARRNAAGRAMAAERAERERAAISPRLEYDSAGRICCAFVPSKSNPYDAPYELERSVRGAWMHVDSRCPGWNRGGCYHVTALVALMAEMETT